MNAQKTVTRGVVIAAVVLMAALVSASVTAPKLVVPTQVAAGTAVTGTAFGLDPITVRWTWTDPLELGDGIDTSSENGQNHFSFGTSGGDVGKTMRVEMEDENGYTTYELVDVVAP